MDQGMFDAIGLFMQIGYYTLVFGLPIGGVTLLTFIVALFIGAGWWMIGPILISIIGALAIDYAARH